MGYATKWANKVVYNACKMQIGQPCLVTILLNPSLLDSAFFCFSCASSSKYFCPLYKIGFLCWLICSHWHWSPVSTRFYKMWRTNLRLILGADLLSLQAAAGMFPCFSMNLSNQVFFAGSCWGLRCYDCEGAHCTDPANLQVSPPFVKQAGKPWNSKLQPT